MRLPVLLRLAAVTLAAAACDQPLTGPEAQRAYADATKSVQVVPDDRLVIVDGRRLAAGERLDLVDPRQILRIEIVKGDAAARLFGDEARKGVIQIFTKAGSGHNAR